MKIRLADIPTEGKPLLFNRATGELNADLKDLIQNRDYEVEMHINPIGNSYEVVGILRAEIEDLCSRCGWDLKLPIGRKFHEYLVEENPDEYRKKQNIKGNQAFNFVNDGPAMTTYKNGIFDVAEFVHEQIALSQPSYPSCGLDDCEHLKEAQAKINELAREFELADLDEAPKPSFSTLLGDIKLKQ
jgi:uncharacterized metal-binding protein YceD (DUF177 family)